MNMNLQRAIKFNRLPEVSLCCHLLAKPFIYIWQPNHRRQVVEEGAKKNTYYKLIYNKHPTQRMTFVLLLISLFSKVTKTPGLRSMKKEDVIGIHSLLQTHFYKFHLSPILSLQEVEHLLMPQEDVIDTYVVEVWLYSLSVTIFVF